MTKYNIEDYEKVSEIEVGREGAICKYCAFFDSTEYDCLVESNDSFDCTPIEGIDYCFRKKD